MNIYCTIFVNRNDQICHSIKCHEILLKTFCQFFIKKKLIMVICADKNRFLEITSRKHLRTKVTPD